MRPCIRTTNFNGEFGSKTRQTMPGADYIEELAEGELPAGVEYHSIFASGDPVAPAHSCRLDGAHNVEVKPRTNP